MVSTLDFESSDPSSNLGGTYYSFTNAFEKHANLYFERITLTEVKIFF